MSIDAKVMQKGHHSSASGGGGALGGGGGAAIDYHFWATGVPRRERPLPPVNRPPTSAQVWEPLPQSWFDNYIIMGDSIEHSARGQDNWHFNDIGQGAITFDVKNAGGNLVIGLTGVNHSDLNGYYVVLDDDRHESYVLKLSATGSNAILRDRVTGAPVTGRRQYMRMPGVYVDRAFRLRHDERQRFWLMYQRGAIVVGEGGSIGQGRIILYMEADPRQYRAAGTDLYHYSFARHGSRWRMPIEVVSTMSYKYKPAPLFSLPPNPLRSFPAASAPMNISVAQSAEARGGPLYQP